MVENYINQLGNDISQATNLKEALQLGKLDWIAKEAKVQYQADSEDYSTAIGYKVVYKDSDKSTLGVVGSNYGVIQNTEAFAIAEALIGGQIKFHRAGQVFGQTYLILKGEDSYLLNDVVENYIIVRNSFDGSSKLQIAWVPVVKATSGLHFLDTKESRVFTIKHSAKWINKYGKTFVDSIVADGQQALLSYVQAMMSISCSSVQLTKVLDRVLPLKFKEDGQPKEKANEAILKKRAEVASLLNSQDLAQYKGTAYAVYRALSELETKSFQEAKIVKPERNAYKKVKRLFTNNGIAKEAIEAFERGLI